MEGMLQFVAAAADVAADPLVNAAVVIDEGTCNETIMSSTANSTMTETVRERLSIAGRLRPLLELMHVSREEMEDIFINLRDAIDVVDVVALIIFCFFTIPLGRFLYKWFEHDVRIKAAELLLATHSKKRIGETKPTATTSTTTTTTTTKTSSSPSCQKQQNQYEEPKYETSVTYTIARLVQQVARLAALVYFMDCMLVVMDVLGFTFPPQSDPSGEFCRIVYFTWTTFKLVQFKRYLLGLAINRASHQLGKAVLCDRLLDMVIYTSLLLGIMDTINFEVGPGLASLFAFGGMGTFIFGLASKDIASQIVSGITLTTSEKFHVGEDVRLGDGTRGIVENMGWLYTDLRMFDEITIKIPNTQLTDQRVSNYSRIGKCRVLVSLRVALTDFEIIPEFCTNVKEALLKECPQLISDGSRPFRANWRECHCDHLEIVIDTHHDIPPIGDVFLENQELVYRTIFKVAKEHNMRLVVPTYNIQTSTMVTTGANMSNGTLATSKLDMEQTARFAST